MGFSITWCAVREERAEQFLRDLGLTPTGEMENIPESLISTARLNTGWRVLWYNAYDCPFLQPEELTRISADKEVVLCLVEEHVMAASSEMWSAGTRQWRLAHLGEDGPKGLSAEGKPPESFPDIRDAMEKAQVAAGGDSADVDYIFEIPLQVAKSIVGFKHDEECQHLQGSFEVMSRPTAPKASFLHRIFGK